jgi:hypothetical protein
MRRSIAGSLFEPDILVSQKYLKVYRPTKEAESEKALMFAVMAEALQTYQKFAFSRSARGKALFREAEAWLWAEDPDIPFSFMSICEVFGFDPAYLKRGLLQWIANCQRTRGSRKRIQLRGVGRTRKPTIAAESRVS